MTEPTQQQRDEWQLRMEAARQDPDQEDAHYAADNILLEVIAAYGYDTLAATYLSVDKWYA